MAAFTTLAILALAGYAAGKTIEAKKKGDALKAATAPQPTMLAGPAPAAPPAAGLPPDPSLAASNAAVASLQAANKARRKAGAGDAMNLGTPGTSTPAPRFQQKTLLGSY